MASLEDTITEDTMRRRRFSMRRRRFTMRRITRRLRFSMRRRRFSMQRRRFSMHVSTRPIFMQIPLIFMIHITSISLS